jgi:hypothetical protein
MGDELTRTTRWRVGSANWEQWVLRHPEAVGLPAGASREEAEAYILHYRVARLAREREEKRILEEERRRHRDASLSSKAVETDDPQADAKNKHLFLGDPQGEFIRSDDVVIPNPAKHGWRGRRQSIGGGYRRNKSKKRRQRRRKTAKRRRKTTKRRRKTLKRRARDT